MNLRYTTVTLVLMIIFEVVIFQGKPVYRKFGSNCTAASVNLSCFYIRTKVFDLSMPLFLTICCFFLLINQSMESLCLMIIFRTIHGKIRSDLATVSDDIFQDKAVI